MPEQIPLGTGLARGEQVLLYAVALPYRFRTVWDEDGYMTATWFQVPVLHQVVCVRHLADEKHATEFAMRLDTGSVGVNFFGSNHATPFGGWKDSGPLLPQELLVDSHNAASQRWHRGR
ncbi:hypothetical protein ACWD4J_18205 [Streptomyces sp. NPDC002577]